ED
ncbi:cysteine protease, YopT-type domain protein, partial [Chlamydia psittaci 08-2626_L3]